MANTKITSLAELSATPDSGDFYTIVDVSDTTMSASGTNKKLDAKRVLHTNGTANTLGATLNGNLQTIRNIGTVGIGGTVPTSPLHVENTGTVTNDYLTLYNNRNAGDTEVGILFRDRNTLSNGQKTGRIYSKRSGTSGDFDLVFHAGNQTNAGLSNEIMRLVGNNSKVGIGTSVPAEALHVVGASNTKIRVDSATYPGFVLGLSGTAKYLWYYDQANDLSALGRSGVADDMILKSGYGYFAKNGEAWNNITYNTGWVDYGGAYTGVQYKKAGDLVFVRGMCKRTSGVNTIIATLPSGYRPTGSLVFPTPSAGAYGDVILDSSGNITADVFGTAFVSLNFVFSTL